MNGSNETSESNSDKNLKHLHKFQTRGGPHDLGDPDDLRLRKVEIEVMIPKKMRDKAKAEKCGDAVTEFTNCCKDSGLLMFIKCRNENNELKKCLEYWYNDKTFRKLCETEYLQERSEYRRTGIKSKKQFQ